MLLKCAFCAILAVALLLACAGCDGLYVNADHASGLRINEVVSSNARSLVDEALGTPDWIELYNASASPINLSGYGLTDNPKEPHKWTFPDVTIPAGGYLVVYATKAGGTLCTGLSRSGDSLCLSDKYYALLDYTDYLIAQTYFANSDMFNQKYWCSADYSVKWRPVFFDLDFGLHFASPTRSILPLYFQAEGVPSQDGSLTNMDIYVGLRRNAAWCDYLCERYVYVVLNYFDEERLTAILDEMAEELRFEWPRHSARWSEAPSLSKWESSIAALRDCLAKRADYALKYLQKEFGVSDEKMDEYRAKALSTSA